MVIAVAKTLPRIRPSTKLKIIAKIANTLLTQARPSQVQFAAFVNLESVIFNTLLKFTAVITFYAVKRGVLIIS